MKRRTFLALAVLLATIPFVKDETTNRWDIINATLKHLFPKYNQFEGAENLGIINFFKSITNDYYFDLKELKMLNDGAEKLYRLYPHFISLPLSKKEEALRFFEQKENGQNWLSKLINYGCEAMFGDPIYGGNKNILGWKAIDHNPGIPRPKVKYAI